jgi:hypothetical protein
MLSCHLIPAKNRPSARQPGRLIVPPDRAAPPAGRGCPGCARHQEGSARQPPIARGAPAGGAPQASSCGGDRSAAHLARMSSRARLARRWRRSAHEARQSDPGPPSGVADPLPGRRTSGMPPSHLAGWQAARLQPLPRTYGADAWSTQWERTADSTSATWRSGPRCSADCCPPWHPPERSLFGGKPSGPSLVD